MPKAAGMQLLLRIRNSPGALAFGDARTSDNDSPRRAGLSIDQFGDVSIDQRNKVKPGDADNCRRAQRRSVIHFERCNFVAFRSITC